MPPGTPGMPPAPPALDLDRDEGEGPILDERADDANARGSPTVSASRSPRQGGSPRVGGSPRWKQPARRHSAPPELPSDSLDDRHVQPPEEPLSNFLFGMLGDTGKHCSENMEDRESELRREVGSCSEPEPSLPLSLSLS